MHRALYIVELVHQIASHTDTASLPGLASTCRAFQDPALDALWGDLPSVMPIVDCLPMHLWHIVRRDIWDTAPHEEVVSISYMYRFRLSKLV